MSAIEREALHIWQERELRMPGPGRRMVPDQWDTITGAWQLCLADAQRTLEARR